MYKNKDTTSRCLAPVKGDIFTGPQAPSCFLSYEFLQHTLF